MVSRIVATIAVGFSVVAGLVSHASAFEEPIPTKISLLKWGAGVGKLYKIVSKPSASQAGGLFQIPDPDTSNPVTNGGSLTVAVGSGELTCALAGGANWKGLGNPAGSKGYKYVN